MRKDLTPVQQEARDFMFQNMAYWLDDAGDIMMGPCLKECYEKYFGTGVNLDDLKDFYYEMNEIYEGRGRELNRS